MAPEPPRSPAVTPAAASGVDRLLEAARRRLRRVTPAEAAELAAAGGLLVDTRPVEQRRRDGEIPGALIIDRNVLEWRLDPASPHRHPAVTPGDTERPVVLFCNEGYSSSLAAATLQELGLANATDLVGGFQAWRAEGRPVVPAGPDE